MGDFTSQADAVTRRRPSSGCFPPRLAPIGSCMPSRPFGGPEQVLKYLARYTHRVAISDSRLLDFEDGMVRIPLQGLRPR